MLLRTKLLVILAATMMVAMSVVSPAFAHHCTNVSKKAGAGSIGTFNVVTETFTPTKDHGGFVTLTDGSTSYDVFINNTLPEGARSAGPGGSQCDGVGIDDVDACLAP